MSPITPHLSRPNLEIQWCYAPWSEIISLGNLLLLDKTF